MSIVGKVDSLWRYPVKGMRGEELEEAFVGFAGVYARPANLAEAESTAPGLNPVFADPKELAANAVTHRARC